MPRIRLCDADRERYGGPEWVELSAVDLMDEETGLIEQVEEQWGLAPPEFLHGIGRDSTKALRALVWLARRKAGCLDPVATFKPKVQGWSGVIYEPLPAEEKAAADADPPANRAERRRSAKGRGKKRSTATSKTSSTSITSDSSASSTPSPTTSDAGPTASS